MAEQNWPNPAVAAFQEQRTLTQSPGVAAVQELYWQDRARNKRGPPTPVASSAATPQEGAPSQPDLTQPTLVQRGSLEDHTAAQLVAAEYGVDINTPAKVEEWLAQPASSNKDVLNLVKTYHAKVIRPEMYHLVLQLETALGKISDDLFATRRELAWMASDNRQQQKQACAIQLITSGWPQGMGPDGRKFQICWMLPQVPKIRNFLADRGNIHDHTAEEDGRWYNVFSVGPVTIPQGQEWWSGMTLLTFKSFDLRSAFLERFGGTGGTPIYSNATTPVAGKHVRISPCSPQWQRKLECPLRVLISVLNQHAEYTGQSLVILWKTLTLMQPSSERSYQPDAVAWGRLFYSEVGGEFRGRLEITPPMKNAMAAGPSNIDSTETDLWSECWNQVVRGSQYDLDQAEAKSYKEAKDHSATTGKGVHKGKTRKHWSNALVHNDYYCPYPFQLDIAIVDQIAFCWDEYCQKMGKPEECVGDMGVATYQGKPPLPIQKDTEGDVAMTTPPSQTTAAPSADSCPHRSQVQHKRAWGKRQAQGQILK